MTNPNCIPEDVQKKTPQKKSLSQPAGRQDEQPEGAAKQPPEAQPEGEPTPEELQEELRKYLRYLPQVAEPSLARVWEIKDEIQKGTYLTREMIEETASRLALRFLRKE